MAMQPPGQYYAPPAQQPEKKSGKSTCLIVGLVILAITVPVLGVMGALAAYGVSKYLKSAKTAEAKSAIGAISRAAVAAYESETLVGGKTVHRLCGSATLVPRAVPKAVKYQPSSAAGADFHAGDENTGWPCLRFEMTQPMYYQYGYVKGAGSGKTGASANGFEASAHGDLNGDGVES